MLIKARVAAGDQATGRALLDFVEPRIYSTTLDFSAIEQLSQTRERLNEKLAARQAKRGMITRIRERTSIDVKLERGGIRDIEFLVQCLQRLYGGTEPWVRHGGTMLASGSIARQRAFFQGAEYGRLASAYQFLRHLEHRLQFEDDLQIHTMPSDPEALELLARRMPGGGGSSEWLMLELRGHLARVTDMYTRVVRQTPPAEAAEPPDVGVARAGNVVLALISAHPRWRAPWLARICNAGIGHSNIFWTACREMCGGWTLSTPIPSWPSTRSTCSNIAPTSRRS